MVSTTRMETGSKARQVLRQVDDLEPAPDAGGRLDLVARDDRAGCGRHHVHLDAKSRSFFSIKRLVISSDSGVTVSCRPGQRRAIDLGQLSPASTNSVALTLASRRWTAAPR